MKNRIQNLKFTITCSVPVWIEDPKEVKHYQKQIATYIRNTLSEARFIPICDEDGFEGATEEAKYKVKIEY